MSPRLERRPARALTGFTIARPFGIELQVHPSWIVSLLVLSIVSYDLIVPSIASRGSHWRLPLAVLFGAIIAACVVVHELAHSLVARGYGLPIRRITLFALGGVSQIESEAPTPRAEFAVALAGPLASVVLATVFGGIGRFLNPTEASIPGVWGELGVINIYLAIFNLIPAFPMDGGRLLRSGLWRFGGRARATRWAVNVGRSFAMLAMGGGAVLLLAPPLSGSSSSSGSALWIIFIGMFIFQAAGAAGKTEGGDRPNHPMVPGVQASPPDEEDR